MKFRLFVLAMLVSLLVSAWTPAPVQSFNPEAPAEAEGAPKLTIDNKTGATVTISLTGPRSYTLTATAGKTTHLVDPGKYKYNFKACGATKTGSLTVEAKGAKLAIPKCVTASVTIQNDTGGTLFLNLSGTATYSFTLPTGKTKISVIKGKYEYRVSGSCGSKTGSVTLKKGFIWSWWCF